MKTLDINSQKFTLVTTAKYGEPEWNTYQIRYISDISMKTGEYKWKPTETKQTFRENKWNR